MLTLIKLPVIIVNVRRIKTSNLAPEVNWGLKHQLWESGLVSAFLSFLITKPGATAVILSLLYLNGGLNSPDISLACSFLNFAYKGYC